MEIRKAEAIATKQRRAKRGISSSSKKEDESDTGDDIDLDQANTNQANDKYPVELLERMQ